MISGKTGNHANIPVYFSAMNSVLDFSSYVWLSLCLFVVFLAYLVSFLPAA
jgi:hypothetical protein